MALAKLAQMIARQLPARTSPHTMQRKIVREALVDALQPMLLAQGFSRFQGMIAWRRAARGIDVVEIGFTDTVIYRRDSAETVAMLRNAVQAAHHQASLKRPT